MEREVKNLFTMEYRELFRFRCVTDHTRHSFADQFGTVHCSPVMDHWPEERTTKIIIESGSSIFLIPH